MSIVLNSKNIEPDHPFESPEQEQTLMILNESRLSKTSECSTQVNMDEEFPREDPAKARKNKKKQKKKKRKEKQRQGQRSAKIHLAEVINLIYERKTTFASQQAEIENCLEALLGGDKFHSFLNQAIRIQVNNIQKEIWDFMQSIIQFNQFDRLNDDQEFYLQMVDKIYEEYQKLKIASFQVQKIINLFMCFNQGLTECKGQCQNLDVNTFNYLVESDESIKSLIRICERRISIKNQSHIYKLKEICSMINEEDEFYEEEYMTETSTEVDEEESQPKKQKKKKKKKNKNTDFSTDEKDVVKRLNEMIIVEEGRSSCQTEKGWLQKLSEKYGKKKI